MNRESRRTHAEIEETQAALRESIAQAKELVARSDGLLLRHKRHLGDENATPLHDPDRPENRV